MNNKETLIKTLRGSVAQLNVLTSGNGWKKFMEKFLKSEQVNSRKVERLLALWQL